MNLRRKLTLQSTGIFALTLAVVFTGTYLIFQRHTRTLFFHKLSDRALIAAFVYFEKDEVSRQNYRRQAEAYQARLSHETIQVYSQQGALLFEDRGPEKPISKSQIDRIVRQREVSFDRGDRQCVGIYYRDNQGDFVIVAYGNDLSGTAKIHQLGLTMLMFFTGGIGLNLLLNTLLAKRTFRPFSEAIEQVNQISAESLDQRLPVLEGKKDEVQTLIATFNYFLDRIEVGVKNQQHFLRQASHELKTPLAALIGELEVALQTDRSAATYAQVIRNALSDAYHLQAIMESLLLISRMQADQFIQRTPLRVDEVLWEVLEKLRVKYPTAEVQVDLERVDPDTLQISGNEPLLFVALTNIIENAIKFSNSQPVQIVFRTEEELIIEVIDRGVGIPPAETNRIFDMFYRASNVRRVAGHGLGLHLTQRILELHGFRFRFDSVLGQGSVFQILL
ncbi:HAMP domain-containing sensor histidine kinase [Larkinella harenae]